MYRVWESSQEWRVDEAWDTREDGAQCQWKQIRQGFRMQVYWGAMSLKDVQVRTGVRYEVVGVPEGKKEEESVIT